ncbi:MAG TPA: PDZ domain-containing protein, partial [Candidatus Portnoybacteria bacterium]|nr:PDZ domain-containing protein [Candidatus Portnoybacteria bacterium]
MNRFLKSYLILIIGLAVFSAGLLIGQYISPSEESEEQVLINKETVQPEEVDFNLFWDVWSLVEEKYADREDLDYQEMIYGAISGLVNSLGDPYSLFMTPQESKDFLEDMQGKFEGIGAEIGIRNGILTIIAPLKNTPAYRAGLRAGDKILKVDETLTADLSIQEAVHLIRGPKGTEVILTILREGEKESKGISIIRDVIE